MTTMLAPGDTRYYLPLVKESEDRVRSASFYIKPGYKMYVSIGSHDNCTVFLEKGEHDHQLKWPMPGMDIVLTTTENNTLYSETICTECNLIVKRREGDRLEQNIINRRSRQNIVRGFRGVLRNVVFLTVSNHNSIECDIIRSEYTSDED